MPQADSGRPNKVWRYTATAKGLSTAALVWEEPNAAMALAVWRTRDGAYLLMEGASDTTNYIMGLDAGKPSGATADQALLRIQV